MRVDERQAASCRRAGRRSTEHRLTSLLILPKAPAEFTILLARGRKRVGAAKGCEVHSGVGGCHFGDVRGVVRNGNVRFHK